MFFRGIHVHDLYAIKSYLKTKILLFIYSLIGGNMTFKANAFNYAGDLTE